MADRANKRGKVLETAVASMLEDGGYTKVTGKRFFPIHESMRQQPIFSQQCHVGKCLYGKNRRVDFILYHPNRWPECLVIQCKWQSSKGSVEEKYPYEVMSIDVGKFKTIIVLDGGGYSQNAEHWVKSQVGNGNLLHVMTLGEINNFQSMGKL